MSVVNPAAINIAVPDYGIDQIIGITTGTFNISAPSSFPGYITTNVSFDTGFGGSCYFQGIFSTDGGTTWNDFGVYQPNLSTPGQPVLQTVTCQGYVTSAGIFNAVGKNWYDNVHSTSNSYTVQYKVVLIAKNDQGPINPLPSSQRLFYDSFVNMQKVFRRGEFSVSTTVATSISNTLGYVPKVRAWFIPSLSTMGLDGIYTLPANAMTTLDWFQCNVRLNHSFVTFGVVEDNISAPNGITGTMQYKIYLDA